LATILAPTDPREAVRDIPRFEVPSKANAGSVRRRIGTLVSAAVSKWIDDRAPSMGAALAYYTAFSLAPVLVIVIAIGGLVLGHDAAQSAIIAQLRDLVGDAGADAISGMLASTSDLGTGALALCIGIVVLLVGATTAFAELQDDLNRIWKAKPRAGSGIWNMIRSRLLTFGMVLCIGFLLTVSLVLNAAVSAIGQRRFGGTEFALQALNFVASVAVTTLLFAAIFKILPNADIAWRDVWTGALVTAVLFGVGRILVGLYIGKTNVGSAFGSAGPFVALLVWIYYSAQVFLLGAEFTCVEAGTRNAGEKSPAPDSRQEHRSRNAPGPQGNFAPRPTAPAAQRVPARPWPRAAARMNLGDAARRLAGASAAGLVTGWVLTRLARSRLRTAG
jgi:membrane protein